MSTIASGVATSAVRVPKLPSRREVDARRRCELTSRDHHPQPVRDVVEVHELVEGLAERLVHDGDRPDAAYRLLQRLPRLR